MKKLPNSFSTGAVALVFLVIGYQVCLFVQKAAVSTVTAHRDRPDTVYVIDSSPVASDEKIIIHRSGAAPGAERVLPKTPSHSKRKVESFRFNPNTVTSEELQRLGFSERQAESIIKYREKGGRFRRKGDFAKSYVVSDSVFKRLEPYIDIPKIDLNKADSAEFDALPGIGPWFASRMVSYRKELRGYSYPEQLMDIWNFDEEKYNGLKDLITLTAPEPYPLWTFPADSLERHPYIDRRTARAIVLYRDNNPPEKCTVEGLLAAGVLTPEKAARLSRCVITRCIP